MPEIPTEIQLLILQKEKELEQSIRQYSDRARNQAIGIFGFIAVIISIIGAFGIPKIIESYAETSAKQAVDQNIGEQYVEAAKNASGLAENFHQKAKDELVKTETIRREAEKLKDMIAPVAEQRLKQTEGSLVPSGTVAWFNLDQCPLGWSMYKPVQGRTIVGANNTENTDQVGNLISKWTLGETGGEQFHTITLDEMPTHNHGGWPVGSTKDKAAMGNEPAYHPVLNKRIDDEGKNKPHNNMSPFLALLPCLKG